VTATQVRTACDFIEDVAQPAILRAIKIEFPNEALAREYLTPPDEPHQAGHGERNDDYSFRIGAGGEVSARKSNVVFVLALFPPRGSGSHSSEKSDAQFKRLLELRQRVLSRL